MIVIVMMVMPVAMVIIMMMVVVIVIQHDQPAHARAEGIAMGTICHVRAGRIRTLPLDMVVVAFLHRSDFALEPEDLSAVFAQDARRGRNCPESRMRPILDADLMAFTIFERQHLTAITANPAVGRRRRAYLLHDPFGERLEHLRMVAQIACLDELFVGMFGGDLVGEPVDPVDQDARKQEIREHDDPFVGKHRNMLQTRCDQREGHT